MNNNSFTYSVGRIRALEQLLLNHNEVERMMLAKSAEDAFSILDELDYANNKANQDASIQDFQLVLDSGILETKELLDRITPDHEILNILWYKYDFHNIKTLIKAKYAEKSEEEVLPLLSNLGAIPVESLVQFILKKQHHTSLRINPEAEIKLRESIFATYKSFEKSKDPMVIDTYLDKVLLEFIYGIAQKSRSQFLVQYLEKFVDLYNIKLFFRTKAADKDFSKFEIAFSDLGTISFAKYQNAYKQSLADFLEVLKGTPYLKIAETALTHFQEEHSFIMLEKEIENYLTDHIKEAKLVPFGPEPLLAYFLAKENNSLIIRMILIHKINQIDPEEIRKRLRNLYI